MQFAVAGGEPSPIPSPRPSPEPSPQPVGSGPLALVAPGHRLGALRDTFRATGRSVVAVDDADDAGAAAVVLGTPESWLAQWRLLGAARESGALVVDAGCAAEFRAVTGRRELPPYAAPGRARAWAVGSGEIRRVALPG